MARRVTEVVMEVGLAPSGGMIRVTQVVMEVGLAPSGGMIRVTQVVMEVGISETSGGGGSTKRRGLVRRGYRPETKEVERESQR